MLATPADLVATKALHPAFYGSYDWHSCVHMHWLLVRVRRLRPALPERDRIDATLDAHFAPAAIAAEAAYLDRPHSATFERPYGWAWLLKLCAEVRAPASAGVPDATSTALARWDKALAPLARAFVERYLKFLPKATYPIRVGTHNNTAFGIALTLQFLSIAIRVGNRDLSEERILVRDESFDNRQLDA